MTLHRDAHGHYVLKFFSRLSHEATSFFLGHEASRDAMHWMNCNVPTPPREGDVADEYVDLEYSQTRGGRFRIPEVRYYVERTNARGELYKSGFGRDDLPRFRGEDEEVQIEPGQNYRQGRLVPCTYKIE